LFFYGQDTWRATNKLTLNYGLRWEIYFPESVNGKDQGGWLDFNDSAPDALAVDRGILRVAGEGGFGNNGNIKNSFGNLAPRLGIAYQIRPKTVIRAGYGRSFSLGVFGSVFGHAVTQNLPVLAVQEINVNPGQVAFNVTAGPGPDPRTDPNVFPAIPSDGRLPLPDGVFARFRPLKMQLPTLDSWNLAIQHQVTNTMSVEVAYVGNKGTHVFSGNGPAVNINQPSLSGFTAGVPQNDRKPFFSGMSTTGITDAVSYAKSYGWTQGIDGFINAASSNYNAL